MRPRSICAWAALLTAACGSSSGDQLFSGDRGNRVISAEAGTDPGLGGGKASGGGGTPGGGGQTHSTGGTGSGSTPPGTGAAPGSGGTSSTGGKGGAGDRGSGGSGGGSAGTPDTGGTAGTASGGAAGDGAGGEMTGNGGSTSGATPHIVACDGMPCQVGSALTSACCLSPVPLATVCIPTLGGGCANGGAAITCDDASDCTSGQICCADSVGNLPITVCSKSCKDGMDQLCRTNDECKQGGSCEPVDAQPEYSRCK